ncbi:hypothetical protein [Pseudomonas sp. JG-B]|uniref:hypothetical protein n=1 Tax=Pseudomonas sp. JG-B TaxID=2603214 RepID=UPI00273E5923|nr:hypothetical protein [Pseudomonas sp. JG-B]
MSWKLTCQDAADGSGDLILELPDDLLEAAGWKVGDILELEGDLANGGAIQLKKTVLCDVCGAGTAETGHGVLQAQWRDGEHEGLRLCRGCFDYAMATLRREHELSHMFDEEGQ